jgi:hypothetical protein
VRVPLWLGPFATSLLVLSREAAPPGNTAKKSRQFSPVLSLDGDWQVSFAGRTLRSTLKPWADWDSAAFSGSASYRKEFRFEGAPPRRAELDLGQVLYAARVRLNGKDLGPRAWRPFRWDVGSALKPGLNVLEVEVANTGANELAADPEHYRELDAKGWIRNSYARMYLPFDREMVPSGLLGPVRILEETGGR